jgi:DNA-binding response OmpR family regulator
VDESIDQSVKKTVAQLQELMNTEMSSKMLNDANKKILIVDDDPDVRKSMNVRLKADHYDTFFAADAVSSMVEERKHEPDLIILDLGLPAGDGFIVIERLKAVPSLAVIPFIVVSGRDFRANQRRVVSMGAKGFLQKPVDNAEFVAVIREVVREGSQPDDPAAYELQHH